MVCELQYNVENITNNCNVNVMGTVVETPCIDICIGAINYALINCLYYYDKNEIMNKLFSIINFCNNI
jgi:hypothetical protein